MNTKTNNKKTPVKKQKTATVQKPSSVDRRKAQSPEFDQRLQKYYDELKWLYLELYENEAGSFEYFCNMLRKFYEERSAGLREIDRRRLSDPEWYRGNGLLGMLIYVDCFGGNISGVAEHLDYLKEAGINYLHLMPLLRSPEGRSDGGYAVSDFRSVEPRLGTIDELKKLADKCHAEGISICLDYVMNHTSEDHEWAMKAKAGDRSYQDKYFFYDNWDIPMQYEKTVPQVFPQTAPGNFTWCAQAGKVVMTTFYPYQWDLNYHNPMVFNDMTANMLYLCNCGIDIIRLDAVPYIWKVLGTSCRNLPQVHSLVRMMRIACEIVAPGTLLLGEVVMEPREVVPYFGTIEKPECHMLYNVTTMASTWHTVATRDVRLLKHQLGQVFALPKDYLFLNYLRCHDDIGWGLDYAFLNQFGCREVEHKHYLNEYFLGHIYGSESRGELYNDDPRLGDARLCGTTASLCGIEAAAYEQNPQKFRRGIDLDILLHAFLYTLSGPPVLYEGDEIGMLNDYTYHEDPLKQADSRYLHRGRINWEDVEKRNDPNTREGIIFDALAQLRKLRASNAVFDANADTWIVEANNDHILGIGRYYDGHKLIALFNFDVSEQTARIDDSDTYTDVFSEREITVSEVKLPPCGFRWLIRNYS
ncbi:MAG: alpha-amylase family protein [Lachnospiraceae bacterium]|nr:alpha-amylase family protein [Lachnospiraceae bacterium]